MSLSRIPKATRLGLAANPHLVRNDTTATFRRFSTSNRHQIRRKFGVRSLLNDKILKLSSDQPSSAPPGVPSDGGSPPSGSSGSGSDDGNDGKPKILESTIVEEDTSDSQNTAETVDEEPVEPLKTDMVPHTAPRYLPYTPIIATNGHPVFPDFVKVISITDQNLADLIQKKVEQKFPYISVVVKRDDNNLDDVAESINDLYSVGTVCQILEMKKFEFVDPAGTQDSSESNKKLEEDPLTATEADSETGAPPKAKHKQVSSSDHQVEKLQILVQGLRRTKIVANLDKDVNKISDAASYSAALEEQGADERFLVGHIEEYPVDSKIADKDTQRAHAQEIILTLRDIMTKNPLTRETIANMVSTGARITQNPAYLSDMCAALCQVETEMIQAVLEETNLEKRLKLALEILKLEQKRYVMQEKIRKDVDEKMKEGSKKYILEQELKHIKKELGITKDDKEDLIKKFTDRLVGLTVPKEIQETIDEEINRFRSLENHSSEFQVTRNYIDWLTCINWGNFSKDTLDLKSARKTLDHDHYSMKDVKDRILEFIAVTKLRGSPSGKIICFHGPPGTGKTSIARSIADCLNREYYRFSVGGMADVNEIKGHRKTYVGSMPGKAIQALKKTKTQNPLILLDEIDKVGQGGHQGDPTAALLELLDPEQNANFLDHYLDVPVDFSKVLFICTANDISRIPGPLRDRMEMIEVGGYILGEKREIAKRHLIPKSLKESGLSTEHVSLSDNVLDHVINKYCRESGVRNLKQQIEKIHRKSAYKLVQKQDEEAPTSSEIDVSLENLKDFIGKPVFTKERLYLDPPVGAVCGLAWTSLGGSTLYIETQTQEMYEPLEHNVTISSDEVEKEKSPKPPGKSEIFVTGNLQLVMKESVSIAHTVAKHFSRSMADEELSARAHKFLTTAKIHLHAPEGAVKKDGPSAGVTIVTALLSLATDRPVRSDVAMTGEISLSGHVLPVGGIKEKVLAAKRAGIKTILLPVDNDKDWDELENEVKEGIEVVFATTYRDVFEVAF